MSKQILLIAFVALLGLCCAENDILIKDLKLYVNCEEFFIKAMCYTPIPLGRSEPGANGEGGLCSKRVNVFGRNQSACDGWDLFDGAVRPRTPAEPEAGWWSAVWDRDLPVIKETGANAIRIYHANAYTRQYSIDHLGSNGIRFPYGSSHVEFMNKCEQYGLKVIFPLPGEEGNIRTWPNTTMYQMIRNIVDEVGNHSALLMWTFGNELPLDQHLVAKLNEYMSYARMYTWSKWNRFVPVSHAVVDNPPSYDWLAASLKVDIFSTNAGYRGLGFQDLWSGNPRVGFSGWAALSQRYNVPVFISEIGWMSLDNTITHQIPTWFNQKWKSLLENVQYGCIGGAFFTFTDIRAKEDPLQRTMGAVALLPTVVDGKFSVQSNVWTPDTLVRKPIIFDSIKNGTYNGVPYNFGADQFALIGRNQTFLSPAECVAVPPQSWSG